MRRVVAMTVVLTLCACGVEPLEASPSTSQQAIIGGEVCTLDDYPTAVALLISANWQTQRIRSVYCTGTLIAPDVVLTAGHCLEPDLLTGGFGTLSNVHYYVSREPDLTALSDGSSTVFPDDAIEVKDFVQHPDFDIDAFTTVNGPGDFYDIALMFLSEPMADVEPDLLITAAEASQLVEGTSVGIAGWGQQRPATSMWDSPPAGQKMCAESTINEMGATEMQIGTTAGRKCHGDSGGPTYLEVSTDYLHTRRVIGVTSHAYDESDCAKGGVDTRVDVFLDWIDEALRAHCADGTRVWCEVEGVITPADLEPAPEPDPDSDPGADASAPDDGGCSATGGASALAALVLLALRRRRA